jgi:hypothetical protein
MSKEKLIQQLKSQYEDEILLNKGINYIYDSLINLEIALEEVKDVSDIIDVNFCYITIGNRKLFFTNQEEDKIIGVFIQDLESGSYIAHDRIEIVKDDYDRKVLQSHTYQLLNFDEGLIDNYLTAAFDVKEKVTI